MPPRMFALCGAPRAGKSTVAEYLVTKYQAKLIDDGMILREACKALYFPLDPDLGHAAFYTQEGKAKGNLVCGKWFTNRQLLGDLGNLLEGFYGDQFMPERAIEQTLAWEHHDFFVFPSVRKNQGITYREAGGIVIEVRRPGCAVVNDFDQFDASLVDGIIHNDKDIVSLEQTIDRLMAKFNRKLETEQ